MEQRFSISTTAINSCWETGNRPYRLFSWRSACVQYLTDLIIPSVYSQSDVSYHDIEIFFLPANSTTSNTGLLSRSRRHQNYNLNNPNKLNNNNNNKPRFRKRRGGLCGDMRCRHSRLSRGLLRSHPSLHSPALCASLQKKTREKRTKIFKSLVKIFIVMVRDWVYPCCW